MTLTNAYLYDGSVFYNLVLLLRKAKKEIQLYTGLIGLAIIILITAPLILMLFKLINYFLKNSLKRNQIFKVSKSNYSSQKKNHEKYKKALENLGEFQEISNSRNFIVRSIDNETIKYHKLLINIEETLRNQLYTSFGEEMTPEEIERGKTLFQDWEDDWEDDDIYDEVYFEETHN